MITENASFKEIQYAFTAHVRDPDNVRAPNGIEDRRMAIYRRLLYRNVERFITNAFPVLHKLYSHENWHKMIRHFFASHQSVTPYFKDIPREFLTYLQKEREPQPEDPVFIKELAHYEWLEIYLAFADIEVDIVNVDPLGNMMTAVPVLSPLAQMHSYSFPVHKIKPDFQPTEPDEQPVFLMVYRNRQDKVGFMELNPIAAMLVGLIEKEGAKTGQQLLDEIVATLQYPNPKAVYRGGEQVLKQLQAKDILLGTRPC